MRKTLIWLLLLLASPSFAAQESQPENFISLADIHFDPFINCKKAPCELIKKLNNASPESWEDILEKYGSQQLSKDYQDTDYPLLKSTVAELEKVRQQKDPDFVLVLGDFLGHNYRENYRKYVGTRAGYANFVRKTLQFLTLEINKAFPETDVYAAVGNNDSYTGDYSVFPGGAFFQETKYTWANLIKNSANRTSLLNNFGSGGYYAVSLPYHAKDKIIVLNTVLFGRKIRGKKLSEAAETELKWLQQQLAEAKQQNAKVMIACHIPPDINISGALIWKFWQQDYWDAFKKIMKEYAETITVLLPAHIHRDIFQFFTLGSFSKIPVNFTQSISPIFGNNPGFKLFTYNLPHFDITDINTYSLDIDSEPKWQMGYNVQLGPSLGMRS